MKRMAVCFMCLLLIGLTACGDNAQQYPGNTQQGGSAPSAAVSENAADDTADDVFSESCIPPFSGEPWTEIHNNIPYFEKNQFTTNSWETYSELDEYGRCGVAFANIGTDLMPTEAREDIGKVKPSGWQTIEAPGVDGGYLFNRCHLIGFQLAGENANEKNLITGTRYLNIKGMLPFENEVTDYVKETGNHVLYRVTPIYSDDNLIADGVLMEAQSVEDRGDGIMYCVFCYNVQPGYEIDYSGATDAKSDTSVQGSGKNETEQLYVINRNTGTFHLPNCSAVSRMNPENKESHVSTFSAMKEQYTPCDKCLSD